MIRAFAIVLASVLLAQSAIAEGLKVVMLGTGTPMSFPDRSGPGVAIISGGETYIIDSGAGIFRI